MINNLQEIVLKMEECVKKVLDFGRLMLEYLKLVGFK
jgi:hypothetical protein